MSLHDASLSELVAELLSRLRHLSNGAAAGGGVTGPLGPGGRAALAARLLAVVLADGPDPAGREAATALEELAGALAGAATPLPGSVWEAELADLARSFEDLAGAWDRHDPSALADAWERLSAHGDALWRPAPPQAAPVSRPSAPAHEPDAGPPPAAPRPSVAAPPPAAVPSAPAAAPPPATAGPSHDPEGPVWLLVSGALRRRTLEHRLAAAGLPVVTLADAGAARERLHRESPSMVVCDDAAPHRFGTRLRELLPAAAPPLVLVRARARAATAGTSDLVWLPPYRVEELLARLHR